MSTTVEVTADVLKASPPIAVTGLTIYGIELSDIVLVVTLIYTVAQLVLLVPRIWQLVRKLFGRKPYVSTGNT